jgi:hypothetical protein
MYCTELGKAEWASQSLLWITSYDSITPNEPKHVFILCQYTRNFLLLTLIISKFYTQFFSPYVLAVQHT